MNAGSRNNDRVYVVIGIAVLIGIVFILRLFFLQVVDDQYKLTAENNVLRHINIYPARGLIYDRKGELLVYNQPAYDLMVIPRQVKDLDTTELCLLLEISKADFVSKLTKARKYSWRKPSIFEKQISAETYARLQEKLYRFNGFFVQTRTLRKYPKKMAAHLLGYVAEVNNRELERDNYYKQGDYIGKSGIEAAYESELRGQKGTNVVMVDVFNRIKGKFKDGKYDTVAVSGGNLTCTIDAELQELAEKLMTNKLGGIVAIEPSTGEILTLVSAPTYDPELLVGRARSKNYPILQKDTLKPLFNRALLSEQNPPGSTFKLINALIGQQEGVVWPNKTYSCPRGYISGNFRMGCHDHRGPLDLRESVQHSCNAYYGNVFRNILDHDKTVGECFDVWRNHVVSFGLGMRYGTDLGIEKPGIVPKRSYYDRYYGEDRWKSLTVISLAIGQGELGTTPLQLANMTAAIANRGYWYSPHLVKAVNGESSKQDHNVQWHETTIERKFFDPVVDGMAMVFQLGGTGYRSRLDSIQLCGKTGTAQNPHGEDHSIFVCFGPKEDPKIALAVFVENAGGGSKYAAPIASLIAEKYLTDTIARTELMEQMIIADLRAVEPED